MLVTFSWFACSQGIGIMATRHVSEKIPISEVPFIMRALGYYPTEQEVSNMSYAVVYVFLLFYWHTDVHCFRDENLVKQVKRYRPSVTQYAPHQ